MLDNNDYDSNSKEKEIQNPMENSAIFKKKPKIETSYSYAIP